MRQYTPTTEVDFVVIGSGAAGGIMAKQLSQAGFSVVVLEQGGWGKYGRDSEYNKDEWLNRNITQDDRLMSDPTRQRNTFRRNDKEKATPGTHSYGCVVGGGTVTYGGSSWRHLPYEFNELSSDPTIPSGTGMADWPITYQEIEPYYVQAEWEMGISGLRVNSPFVAPMSKDYPVPPVPLKSSGALFNTAAAKLGLTVVPGPLAIITRPYHGSRGVRELRHLFGLWLPRARAVELCGHGAAAGAENRTLRDSREQLRARDFRQQRGTRDRRRLLRCPEA